MALATSTRQSSSSRSARQVRSAFSFGRLLPFRTLLAVVGGVVPRSLSAVVLFLVVYAWPAIMLNGLGFIGGDEWNLGNCYGDPILRNGVSVLPGAHYAILFLIGGTVLSTLVAMLGSGRFWLASSALGPEAFRCAFACQPPAGNFQSIGLKAMMKSDSPSARQNSSAPKRSSRPNPPPESLILPSWRSRSES